MRAHAKDDSVRFIVCYQREPHAGQLGVARVEAGAAADEGVRRLCSRRR